MFNLVILLLVAGLIGFLIGREAKERAAKKGEKESQKSFADSLKRANPFARGRGDKAQLETWLSSSSKASKRFQDWYQGLDDKNQKAFVRALAQFAGSFGVKLSWLNDEALQKNGPDLYASVEDLVNDYSLTYRKAEGAKTHAHVLSQLEKWQAHPSSAENKEITEGVYASLKSSNAITHTLPEKGSARKKREAMVEAIENYRKENADVFYATFTAQITGANAPQDNSDEREQAKVQPSKRDSDPELAPA
jgi:hypothetical protein